MSDIKLSEKLDLILDTYLSKVDISAARKVQLRQIVEFAYKEGSINGRKTIIKNEVNE